MKKLIRYCNWELKNEFIACGYFSVMLLMYCIIDWIFGIKDVNIFIIFEMFLTNYVLSTLHKIILDTEKDYPSKSFILRAILLSVISVIVVIIVSVLCGWFDGMPRWTGLTIYSMLIISYLTVWIIINLGKKYDTNKLNEQLANFKKNNKQE